MEEIRRRNGGRLQKTKLDQKQSGKPLLKMPKMGKIKKQLTHEQIGRRNGERLRKTKFDPMQRENGREENETSLLKRRKTRK